MVNKYEIMNNVLHDIAKMDIPIRMSLNRWGEWHIFVFGQKFVNKDVCLAVGEAVKLVLKVESK